MVNHAAKTVQGSNDVDRDGEKRSAMERVVEKQDDMVADNGVVLTMVATGCRVVALNAVVVVVVDGDFVGVGDGDDGDDVVVVDAGVVRQLLLLPLPP